METEDIKDILDKYSMLESRVHSIVKDVYDEYVTCINSISLDGDGDLNVSYGYTCRGCHDNDYCFFPAKWLEDGFDYKAAYEEEKRKTEERRKQEAVEEQKKAEAKKARDEKKLYLKLKAKYEKKA